MLAWILLLTVLGGILWWSYTRGPGIVTPIPTYVATSIGSRDGGFLTLWRLLLILMAPFAVVTVLAVSTSPVTLWLLAGLTAGLLVPQIRQAILDVWEFDFFRIGGN